MLLKTILYHELINIGMIIINILAHYIQLQLNISLAALDHTISLGVCSPSSVRGHTTTGGIIIIIMFITGGHRPTPNPSPGP